jgi:sporadic carbohydrate cluster 2OG-Fe(II) oxygenase
MELDNKKIKNCINEFVKKGYVIRDIQNMDSLNWINKEYKKIIKQFLSVKNINNDQQIFNQIHNYVKLKDLNKFRLSVFNEINKKKYFKYHYYNIAKEYLDILVGNELAIQSRINLSIQFPNDKSSLLPLHADTWSGVSPYEIVVWLPLVDCYKTKSMYFYDITKMKYFDKVFKNKTFSTSKIFNQIKKNIKWLNVKFGQILIFDQSIPHGNAINKERETRWSMNCRFKGIFTPYADKRLGEFFEPISIKPVSIKALKYKHPK